MPTTSPWPAPTGAPKNGASPNVNTPPSEATIQYPRPLGVAAIPTIGWLSRRPPIDPKNGAPPTVNRPPSDATRYEPAGVWAAPTIGAFRGMPTDTPLGRTA